MGCEGQHDLVLRAREKQIGALAGVGSATAERYSPNPHFGTPHAPTPGPSCWDRHSRSALVRDQHEPFDDEEAVRLCAHELAGQRL
jgi:hypothetical protein